MRWRLLGAAFLVLVGAAAVVVVLVRPGAASTGDAQYLTAQVTRSTVTSQIAANGALAPAQRWGLAFGQAPALLGSSTSASPGSSGSGSSVTWPVTAVNVAPGATVKKGDVLATADTASLNSQISQANYTLATAQISLEQATSNLDAATTQQQIWQAKSAYYNAESTVARDKQAKADLVAQKALATITAPADGVIEVVNVTKGLDAPSGDAFVIDTGGLQAVIGVTETDLPNVQVGQTAAVAISAVNGTAQGTVTVISPTATGGNASVVTYPVTVSLSSAPDRARSGMSVSVSITIAQVQNAIAVPSIALVGQTGSYSVRVMGTNGAVTDVPVTVGLITSNLAQITSGLTVGQQVVTGVSTAQTGTSTTGGFGGIGGGFRGVNGGGGFGR